MKGGPPPEKSKSVSENCQSVRNAREKRASSARPSPPGRCLVPAPEPFKVRRRPSSNPAPKAFGAGLEDAIPLGLQHANHILLREAERERISQTRSKLRASQ